MNNTVGHIMIERQQFICWCSDIRTSSSSLVS